MTHSFSLELKHATQGETDLHEKPHSVATGTCITVLEFCFTSLISICDLLNMAHVQWKGVTPTY